MAQLLVVEDNADILHLIWTQELIIDMTQPLTARTLLRRRTA